MYKVLIVDDEPLILAGIKMMMDWSSHDYEIIGTARNGEQALAFLQINNVDIVIADINMPVMDGIELLKRAEEDFKQVVFIMLTNLQDFELARKALRYRAVEYLVKSQLEEENLLVCLNNAIKEVEKRRKLFNVELEQDLFSERKQLFITETLDQLLYKPSNVEKALSAVREFEFEDDCCLLDIRLVYPFDIFTTGKSQSPEKLYRWQCEFVSEIARNCFKKYNLVTSDLHFQSIGMFVWGTPAQDLSKSIEHFNKKLFGVISDISGIQTCVLCPSIGEVSTIEKQRMQLFKLRDTFYNTEYKSIIFDSIEHVECHPLALRGIEGRLRQLFNSKNITECNILFDKIKRHLCETFHKKNQALNLCGEILNALYLPRQAWINNEEDSVFSNGETLEMSLEYIAVRNQVIEFIELVQSESIRCMKNSKTPYSKITEQVKNFIREHVEEKISLNDVADEVFISPGYLSAIFKKQTGLNLFDFINQTKIDRACELIEQGDYLIAEIGNILGYDNANYFTKVFKRYKGVTPSAYSNSIKKGAIEHNV